MLAVAICVSASVIEVNRALGGNQLSWAYVFEWPVLGAYSIYMWRRLVRDERGQAVRPVRTEVPAEDPALADWNRYLSALHAHDAATKRSPRSG